MRPTIALSIGDPAGIGPEVALKAIADGRVRAAADVVLVGDEGLARAAAAQLRLPIPERVWSPPEVSCPTSVLFAGKPSPEGGRAALAAVRAAIALVREGRAGALVTAPLSKEGIALAGEHWPGHTELLADELHAPRVRMMLAGGPLRVVLATTHLALRDVPSALTVDSVAETLEVARDALARDFGVARPRLALCALNPHASDGGRFGDEEARILVPAAAQARARGVEVDGPLPSDTLFARAARPDAPWQAVVALYHDQGLIPLKVAAFGVAVNVTLGLPIVRTSPDHGTAYDIAGKGVADPSSLIHAIEVALELLRVRATQPQG
jgi:4-hydroxythreonine-4-phosphate dehydrogenase